MIGAEAARQLNRDYVGPTVHRRGCSCHNMFLDGHVRLQESVIVDGNMCPVYLQNLGTELSMLDREVFDEFFGKIRAEVDNISPQGRAFGSCPLLLTDESSPALFRHVRETALFSAVRNYMCKSFGQF